MGQQVKDYVGTRRTWIENNLLTLTSPNTPGIRSVGPAGFPVTDLEFESSAFSGTGMTADAIEWRIGEIRDPVNTPLDHVPGTPYIYEIEPLWETGPLAWDGTPANRIIPVSALTPGRTYRARVRHRAADGSWSSWSAPVEFVAGAADVSAYQAGLVVSELMYHPRDATAIEIGAGFTDSDFEYIELTNAGPITLDLTELQFTDGISFAFAGSAITTLAPGERVLVVRNIAAFESRYGAGLPVAGEYPGSAFSNDGEHVEISLGLDSPILAFTYNDQPPWPTGADDGVNGFPMVLIHPDSVPDHDVAENWTAGEVAGGNPGAPDLLGFDRWTADYGLTNDPVADPDGDGLAVLLEYVLAGGDPLVPNTATLPTIGLEALDLGDGPRSYASLRGPRPLRPPRRHPLHRDQHHPRLLVPPRRSPLPRANRPRQRHHHPPLPQHPPHRPRPGPPVHAPCGGAHRTVSRIQRMILPHLYGKGIGLSGLDGQMS